MMDVAAVKRPEFAPLWPYHPWPIYASDRRKVSPNVEAQTRPQHWIDSLETPVKENSELYGFIHDIASHSTFPKTVEDIIPAVHKMIECTAELLSKHNELFHNVCVLRTGSIEEHTRISKLDEFDFIFLLDEKIVKENMEFCFSHDHFALKGRNDLVDRLLQTSGNYRDSIILKCVKQVLLPGWSLGDNHEFTYSNALCVHLIPPDSCKSLRHVAVDICIAMTIDSHMIDETVTGDKYNTMIQTLKFYKSQQSRIIAILRFTRKTIVTKRFVLRDHELNLFNDYGEDDGRLVCYRIVKYVIKKFLPSFFALEEYRDFIGTGSCHAYTHTEVNKPFSNVLDDWCDMSCYKTMVSTHGMKNIMLYMMQHYSTSKYWNREQLGNRVIEVLLIIKQILVHGYSINMFYWRSAIEIDYFSFKCMLELLPVETGGEEEVADNKHLFSLKTDCGNTSSSSEINRYYWKDGRGALREVNAYTAYSPILWTERMKHFESFPICYTVDDIHASVLRRVIFIRRPSASPMQIKQFEPFLQKICRLMENNLNFADSHSLSVFGKKLWAPMEELYFIFSGFSWLVISSFWLSSSLSTLTSTVSPSSEVILPWWHLSTGSSSDLSLFWSWASSLSNCKTNQSEPSQVMQEEANETKMPLSTTNPIRAVPTDSESLHLENEKNVSASHSPLFTSNTQSDPLDTSGTNAIPYRVREQNQDCNQNKNVTRECRRDINAAPSCDNDDSEMALELHLNNLEEFNNCQKELCTWLCLVSGLEHFQLTEANELFSHSSQLYASMHVHLKDIFQLWKQKSLTSVGREDLCRKMGNLKSQCLELFEIRQQLEKIIETKKKSESNEPPNPVTSTSIKLDKFDPIGNTVFSTQNNSLTSRDLLHEFITCFESLEK